MPPVKKPKTKPIKKDEIEEKTMKKEETPVVSGQLSKKIQKHQKRNRPQRGVVLIQHLPHGFFEDQLRNYFQQFGAVTRLRLARSKRTGGTKGYAFVEFEYPEVAEVAAETMDNYLMFNKVVKAAYIPPEKQTHNFFRTSVRQVKNKAGKSIYVSAKTAAINRDVKRFNNWTEDTYQKRTAAKLAKIAKLNKKYSHLGIDFNSIVTGSQKLETSNSKEKKPKENAVDVKSLENNAETTKSDKRKGKATEKNTKKSKPSKDLQDSTLQKDSSEDDEDFGALSNESETGENESSLESIDNKTNNSMQLEDLLGATLNEDSDDEDWSGTDDDDESADNIEEGSLENTDDLSDEDDLTVPKESKSSKPIKKKGKNNKKNGHLEEIIQSKKHTGRIQKIDKNALNKQPKMAKAKNPMQAALVKQLAKPLPDVKNKIKTSKKQKK